MNSCKFFYSLLLLTWLQIVDPKFTGLMPFVFNSPAQAGNSNAQWDYDNFAAWGNVSSVCVTGRQQSPIALSRRTSITAPIWPLRFHNYYVPLETPIHVSNTGSTVEVEVERTENGRRPSVSGGRLKDRYEVNNVHFHWGTRQNPGAEHTINGRRFDVEVHIVHVNERYGTLEEALNFKDGLVVLGIMLEIVGSRDQSSSGYNKIFNRLPELRFFESEAFIYGRLALHDLLKGINTRNFFTYSGSLTTPTCSEVVTWFVFPDAIPIAYEQIRKLYRILDEDNRPLLNNFRPLQRRNNRLIFYKDSYEYLDMQYFGVNSQHPYQAA